MKEERKKLTSLNLALLLVHDVLFSKGIQAGDGPIKQAVLRHKTRLRGELQKLKIKRGVRLNSELAQVGDQRAGMYSSISVMPCVNVPFFSSADTSICTSQYGTLVNGKGDLFIHLSRVHPLGAL